MKVLEKEKLIRTLREQEGAQGPRIIFQGKEVLNFCSNNYLGLADDFRLVDAAIDCMKEEGFGSGASRLICGNMSAHQKLEKKLAQFKGTEACLLFSTGYMANIGIISSLFSRNDIIFSDRFNHASIIDGILLSGAKVNRYQHRDMSDLERMLQESEEGKQRCIVTDSVFSMDGDIAPLDKIVVLAKKYHCMVMVDEAHALGVMGKRGKGLVEHFALENEIDIQMGTLSKAVGSFGAYCCGSHKLISFLVNKARPFIYTTAMPPSIAAASYKSVEIIEEDVQRRETLWKNTTFVEKRLRNLGFNILDSQTPIIPIVVGDSKKALEFSRELFDQGIFISAIRPPTVPKGSERLRLTLMATHTQSDIEYLVCLIEMIGKKLEVI